nr:hypothetical protein [Blastococcus saxobsidens]
MAAGSDVGEPGPRLGPGDLAPDEERLLAALERDTGGAPAVPAADAEAFVRGAAGVGRPPARGRVPDDGLVPRFTAPGGD